MKVYRVHKGGYPEERRILAEYIDEEDAETRLKYEKYTNPESSDSYFISEYNVKSSCDKTPSFEYRVVASTESINIPNIRDKDFKSQWFNSYSKALEKYRGNEFYENILPRDIIEKLEDWQIPVELDKYIERKYANSEILSTENPMDDEKKECMGITFFYL